MCEGIGGGAGVCAGGVGICAFTRGELTPRVNRTFPELQARRPNASAECTAGSGGAVAVAICGEWCVLRDLLVRFRFSMVKVSF